MDQNEALITLGKTEIQIPHLGVGAWAWGDRRFWNYGQGYNETDIRGAFDTSLAGGVNFIDTAEVYGSGASERFLGSFLPGASSPVVVATKFFPFPWRLSKASLVTRLAPQPGAPELGACRPVPGTLALPSDGDRDLG